MRHTTITLRKEDIQTLERYFPGKMPMSTKICELIKMWASNEYPYMQAYRDPARAAHYTIIRVHLPEEVHELIPVDINLSASLRNFLSMLI